MGSSGLEPPTSRLSGARSNQLSYEPIVFLRCSRTSSPGTAFAVGGDDGIRTHDPLLAGQVLSQLSYTPFPFRGRVPESFPLRVGSDLSSRTVPSQVFSALQSLTTVFGMGTGGPSALLEPTSRYLSVPSVRNNRSRIELFASAFRLRLSP